MTQEKRCHLGVLKPNALRTNYPNLANGCLVSVCIVGHKHSDALSYPLNIFSQPSRRQVARDLQRMTFYQLINLCDGNPHLDILAKPLSCIKFVVQIASDWKATRNDLANFVAIHFWLGGVRCFLSEWWDKFRRIVGKRSFFWVIGTFTIFFCKLPTFCITWIEEIWS